MWFNVPRLPLLLYHSSENMLVGHMSACRSGTIRCCHLIFCMCACRRSQIIARNLSLRKSIVLLVWFYVSDNLNDVFPARKWLTYTHESSTRGRYHSVKQTRTSDTNNLNVSAIKGFRTEVALIIWKLLWGRRLNNSQLSSYSTKIKLIKVNKRQVLFC